MKKDYKNSSKKFNVVCIELLKSFTEIELKNLERVAACSYHNSDKIVFKLLIFIINKVLTNKEIINESVQLSAYNATFTSTLKKTDFLDFHKKKLNDKFNKLTRLAEKFLVLENLKGDKYQYNDLLLEKLTSKKQFGLLQRLINKNKKNLQKSITKNIEFYQHSLIIEKNQLDYYYKNETLYGDKSKVIQQINYNLDLYYILYKLSIQSTLLSIKEPTVDSFEQPTFHIISSLIDLPIYNSLSHVQLLKAAVRLLAKKQEKEYNEFVGIIKKHEKQLSVKDLCGFYAIANNYLIREMKKGKLRYKNLLTLYKEMEKQNIILEDELTPIIKLKNIIIAACNEEDFNWAERILDKYISMVEKSIRKSVYLLNMGIIAFYQKDFEKTLFYLIKTEPVNFFYDKSCRLLTIRCHYELDKDYDERSIRIFRSAEQYFKNIKPSNKIDRIGYSNFFKIFINLYRIKHDVGKGSLNKIKEKLASQEFNIDKNWLLLKINELEK